MTGPEDRIGEIPPSEAGRTLTRRILTLEFEAGTTIEHATAVFDEIAPALYKDWKITLPPTQLDERGTAFIAAGETGELIFRPGERLTPQEARIIDLIFDHNFHAFSSPQIAPSQ